MSQNINHDESIYMYALTRGCRNISRYARYAIYFIYRDMRYILYIAICDIFYISRYAIYGTVSAKIATRLKCYKNASRLNRYNFPTDNAIDFLFSTLHSEMVYYEVLKIGSR